jgi:hypothetical protein
LKTLRRFFEMKLAMKSTGKNNSSARVVDGKLILSYPEALTPVVWQMDLAQAKASALEVRETKGNFSLVLKTAKGETVEVAPFATKDEAVAALMAAARALENAHGQIRPASVAANESNGVALSMPVRGKSSRLKTGLLGIGLIIVLLFIWTSLAPRPPRSLSSGSPSASSAGSAPQSFGQQEENGVPLSADEFLLKRQMQ